MEKTITYRCQRCGREYNNVEDTRFPCNKIVGKVCKQCGGKLPPDGRACPNSGTYPIYCCGKIVRGS
ncbi:MAG: hypothetical protein H8D67_14830 [Deltaproteobacteria bacterium]|nr:hypothetical protein [Deltaproteobacteria bacterium]